MSTVKREPTFEEVWTDVWWTFDMAFDYRDRYYKKRYLRVQAGTLDLEANRLERSSDLNAEA